MQHAHRAHLRLTVSRLRRTSHKSPRVAPPGLGTSAALQILTWRGFATCVGSPTPGAQPSRYLFSVALTQDPTRGDEWHPKQRFDTVLWFERMMIFFALPSFQNYASTQHSGLARFGKSTGPSPGTTRLALGAKHPVGKPCSALASFFNRFALAGEGVHTISSAAHCFDSLAYPDCSILEVDYHADTQCSAQGTSARFCRNPGAIRALPERKRSAARRLASGRAARTTRSSQAPGAATSSPYWLGRCRRWPLQGCPRYPARRLRGAIGGAGRQSGIGGELMVRYRLSAAAQTDLIDILGVVLARCMQPICAARASPTWAHTSQPCVLVRV